jgi:SPASM domain peptide maturase of grasp-with-spasm system
MRYVNLYPCCDITKGKNRSCLYDFERGVFCSVPNYLYNIIINNHNVDYDYLISEYGKRNSDIIVKYLSALEKEKFIFTSNTKNNSLYGKINLETDIPYDINCIIIDITKAEQLPEILDNIDVSSETIQLRIFDTIPHNQLEYIINVIQSLHFNSLEVIFNYSTLSDIEDYISIYNIYSYISRLIIMNYNDNISINNNGIILNSQKLYSKKQCGIINENLFTPNIHTYLHSKKFNTCLYKKISIDNEGYIKNCPSMVEYYGNIRNDSISKVLKTTGINKYWYLRKDSIETCKECEYRDICTDCRAYLCNPDNIKSKPLKCGYNPNKCVWDNWKDLTENKQAIKYYNFNSKSNN